MTKPTLLVLDDEKRQQEILSLILADAGHDVVTMGSPVEALRILEAEAFDAVLTDLRMPGMNGLEFLERAKRIRPDQVIVVITAHGTVPSAVEAMKKGAFHYLTKPLDREELIMVIERAVEQGRLIGENKLLHSQLDQNYSIENIVGRHGSMQEVFRLIRRVAATNTTVMIYGESGAGKELVARAIHQMSPRSQFPIRAINCAAIPEGLIESELFGFEKGAFTGAYIRKRGLLEEASGSTLFLDEVGDLSPGLQGKLLRVLQEREIVRLGGNATIPVDVRIISATRRDLVTMLAEGSFREDLYYRLNTFPISIPPLRERTTDIPRLVDHFLKRLSGLSQRPVRQVSPAALERLVAYHWPGNVRQLESTLERAVILADDDVIDEKHLPSEILLYSPKLKGQAGFELPEEGIDLEELEKHLLSRAMEKSGGVVARAARLLGLSYRTLQYRLEKYQISLHPKS